jgi:SAM-dependent methyltransferase
MTIAPTDIEQDGATIWATPREVRSLDACEFYHTMDVPPHGLVHGQWDLRGDVDAYFGQQDLRGKRVLELGPASGFLTFEMEKRGADVVGLELADGRNWDVVPFGSEDLRSRIEAFAVSLERMKNGFWLAHAANASQARIVYGNIYEIPSQIGPVDIALFGSILLHLRDPFGALAAAAPLVREKIIVTEPEWFAAPALAEQLAAALPPGPRGLRWARRIAAPLLQNVIKHIAAAVQTALPVMYFLPHTRGTEKNFQVWWHFSPQVLEEFLQVLGFPRTTRSSHTQLFLGKPVTMWTIVAERSERVDRTSHSPSPTDPLVPPDALLMDGSRDSQDYVAVGDDFLTHFVQIGGLQPTDRVLEIGAGTGRMARPLTRYLTDGEYCGIEIVASAANWAKREISARHPNFNFIHADVHNLAYNPAGLVRPAEYRFPFPDATFDFAIAASVFTHMYPADIEHYLHELARVLRPGGRCLATFFLLNRESHASMAAGRSLHRFSHPGDGYYALDPVNPEVGIALEETDVRRMYRAARFDLIEPIFPGGWTGRSEFRTYQDIVVARTEVAREETVRSAVS